jgi:hypothetical protein
MKIYKIKDLEEMRELISAARKIVYATIIAEKIKDSGSCTLGAGIYIRLLPKGARKNYVNHRIVDQPFQGNMSNYQALRHAIEFLRENGIDCCYDDGRMD